MTRHYLFHFIIVANIFGGRLLCTGCCLDGYHRGASFCRQAVLYSRSFKSNNAIYDMTCGPHQVYKSCQACEKTCANPTSCEGACLTGCFCREDFYKGPDGKCVKLEDCPKAEITLSNVNEPSIEECQPDEVFVSCGWCEQTCSEPSPVCPSDVCTRGCLCRPSLLRHQSGHCVEAMDCLPQKCTNPNEEYVCRYGCEPRCDIRTCIRPRRCSLGCHCKLGLLRDKNGRCVTIDNCTMNTTTYPLINV